MSTDHLSVSGHVESRFEPVQQAFLENFTERGDVGASFALIVDDVLVVDLVGGWTDADHGKPWDVDTVVNVWSATKGVLATCFAMLVDAGKISYEDPVSKFWLEFAAADKGEVSIADLLSHQAGLSGFTEPATVADILSGSAGAARLAAQRPLWSLGDGSGYHAITIGILATELFRRIEGRSLKEFVAAELRSGRGLDISIGLDPSEDARRAQLIAPPDMDSAQIGSLTPVQIAALGNPLLNPLLPNTPEWRRADLPSANGHTNARALARLYAALISADHPLISKTTLARATALRVEGVDKVLDLDTRWGAGFLLNSDGIYGPNAAAFGHSGWGGAFAFADPLAGIAMSYTMNRMGTQLRDDPRDVALISAVYSVLGAS